MESSILKVWFEVGGKAEANAGRSRASAARLEAGEGLSGVKANLHQSRQFQTRVTRIRLVYLILQG